MVKEDLVEVVDIPKTFDRKIRTSEGDLDLLECIADLMNRVKKIEEAVI